jgi:hypothetical protein
MDTMLGWLRATAGISVQLGTPQYHHSPSPTPATTALQHPAIANMLFPSLGLLAAATSLLSLTAAHNIQMKAHQRECFHESLHKDDTMTVSFQVGDREFGGSGNLEIDFWVSDWSAAWRSP